MKPSPDQPLAAVLLLAGWLAMACHLQAADPTPAPSPPAETAGEEAAPGLQIPVAIGQEIKGIRVPNYDRQGRLTMRFNAASASRLDEDRFDFTDLAVELFEEGGGPAVIQINIPKAIFNRATRLLTSETPSTVRGENFQITGQSLEFDSATRFSRMTGRVVMTVTSPPNETHDAN